MGQLNDKCSCLKKKEDNETHKFEELSDTTSKIGTKTLDHRDHSVPNPNKTFLEKIKKPLIKSSVTLSKHGKTDSLQVQKLKEGLLSARITHMLCANIINKYIRGYLFRKQFIMIKINLIAIENNLISETVEKMTTVNIRKIESLHSQPIQRDGWQQYYKEEDKFNVDYGVVFKCKLRKYSNNSCYIGTVNLKGLKHGFGVYLNKNAEKFEGHWINDSFTGWGRYIDCDGNLYEGKFTDGILDGLGEKRTLTHNVYIGEFRSMLKHGQGKEDTLEHFYEGEFQNDKKHGKGQLQYKSIMDHYEGEFYENAITGFGFYTWANKDTYEGNFLNGKMHGVGTYKYADGGEYTGDYMNNIKEGKGTFTWASGKVYTGPFKLGRPHGIGKLHFNNKIVQVEFKNGKLDNINPIQRVSVI